jgi:hypothetical protein
MPFLGESEKFSFIYSIPSDTRIMHMLILFILCRDDFEDGVLGLRDLGANDVNLSTFNFLCGFQHEFVIFLGKKLIQLILDAINSTSFHKAD